MSLGTVDLIFYLIIILASAGGFSLASYIYTTKRQSRPLVCPVGTSCDTVVHSEYSRFFGIPVELLGMLYYGIIVVSYTVLVLNPALSFLAPGAASTVIFILLGLTLIALLFSGYLTFIQAFTLRQWCTWCLISAGLCVLIFAFALAGSEYGFIELITQHNEVFLGLHLFGVAVGLGGATISDVLFFKFLKDLRISEFEASVLHTLSQIIWFALAIFIISGLGLYLPETAALNQSAKFLVKMIAVAVIIVNGAFLNLLIAPNLVRISFGQPHDHAPGELHHIRRLAYALGAISLTSWYTAFILGLFRSSPADFGTLLGIYAAVLIVAIIISQIIEKTIGRRPMSRRRLGI